MKTSLVALAAVNFCIFSLNADIVINTFGPNQSVQVGPGVTIGGGILRGDPPGHQGVTAGFDFTPAFTSVLTEVDLGWQYIEGPANVDVSIYSDNVGQPGSPIETIQLTDVNTLSTILVADSITHPVLTAGSTYWLIVAPPDLLHTAFDWSISPLNGFDLLSATRLGHDPWEV